MNPPHWWRQRKPGRSADRLAGTMAVQSSSQSSLATSLASSYSFGEGEELITGDSVNFLWTSIVYIPWLACG